MASSQQPPEPTHSPAALLQAFLSTIETHIVPLTAQSVSRGSKVFGAAILSKADLAPLTVATNNEAVSPLLHGEVNCIQEFFARQTAFPSPSLLPQPPSPPSAAAHPERPYPAGSARPSPRSCFFLATHEPCSLCLSALAWSGFDAVFYLFAHEDSRDLFAIPYDIQILEEVFRVPPSPSTPPSPSAPARPLYNRCNRFFTARGLADLAGEVAEGDEGGRAAAEGEIARVRALYDVLGEAYQRGKREGVGSASFWK